MQAIILAAGMGRRLGKYTKDNTKCMLPVNGIRLIDRLLTQLTSLSLNRVIIVVGYKGQNVINHIGNRYQNKLNIEYITNPVYDKTNNIYSLALAKDKLQEDDTILIESDLIFSDGLFKLIAETTAPNIALVAKYESWMDGTMVRVDDDYNIVSFVPKQAFKYTEIDSYYKTINIYKLSRDFCAQKYVPFLEAYSKALGNNEYYEQVLRVITMIDKSGMKALPIGDEKWYEIDDVQDLDIAETIFADDEHLINKYSCRYGGYWRFPKLLDFCYLVNPYFPPQQMIEEMKSNFVSLLQNYPSGMYVNSLLAGKYFDIEQDYIVVGNGAAELIKSFMEQVNGKVGVIYPTFEEYPHRVDKKQIVPFIPNNADFRYSATDITGYYDDKEISQLLIINPDNPSGNFIPISDLLSLVSWAKERNINITIDESFVDFTDDFKNNTLLQNHYLEANHNLIVIKSISKSFGVPGLRLGVLASANTNIISKIKKDVAIWNINSFGECYMQIYGKYSKDYDKACLAFIEERQHFYNELQSIKYLRVIPSQANFFLCEVVNGLTSRELVFQLLKKYNIFIKECSNKTALTNGQYIRIAIRNRTDNDKLVKALTEIHCRQQDTEAIETTTMPSVDKKNIYQ